MITDYNTVIKERLTELAQLEDGWLDGYDGLAINRDCLSWAEPILVKLAKIQIPRIYPRVDDRNIQAEWTFGDYSVTLRFDYEEKELAIRAVSLKHVDRAYLTDSEEDLDKLIYFVNFYLLKHINKLEEQRKNDWS